MLHMRKKKFANNKDYRKLEIIAIILGNIKMQQIVFVT